MGRRSTATRPPARLDSLDVAGDRVSCRLCLGDRRHELAFRAPDVSLRPRYEPFVVAALPIAMRAASSLSVSEPVSERMLDGLGTVQRILSTWFDELREVELEAVGESPTVAGDRDTVSFFSGGVDGFYTALANHDELDSLVYIHGFELAVPAGRKREHVAEVLRTTASELELSLIEVDSNLRAVAEQFMSMRLYQGAFMASVGHLLGANVGRVLVPATHSYRDLFPFGTHPLLEGLWSSEEVEVVLDGVAGRVDKIGEISRSAVAMRRLRVCWDANAAYNCGRCEKCLRTMTGLRIVGALGRCEMLPSRLDLRQVRRMRIRDLNALAYARDNLDAAEARGNDVELIGALRGSVRRGTAYLMMGDVWQGRPQRAWRAAGRAKRLMLRIARGGRSGRAATATPPR